VYPGRPRRRKSPAGRHRPRGDGAVGIDRPQHFDESFAATNVLRTAGTESLLAAARRHSIQRFVAQSFARRPYERTGGAVKTEEDPLDPSPLPEMHESLDAIRTLEELVLDAGGIVLRCGGLYGSSEDAQLGLVRGRRFPIVGDGTGVTSYVHLGDATAATVLAVEQGIPGIYNIVDDEPARASEWLPALAETIDGKAATPCSAPAPRCFAGDAGVMLMTESRGASNAKAKRELGWKLQYPSWPTASVPPMRPNGPGRLDQ